MIRGLCTSLKAVFSYHLTGSNGSTAFQLWPLFWDAIFTLELVLNLKVVFVDCDGASQNRKFSMLRQNLKAFPATGNNTEKETLCHFTVNLADTNRKKYFISDIPNLIKTTRNCLLSSGFSEKSTRLMWNDGKYLIGVTLQEPSLMISKMVYIVSSRLILITYM